MTEAEKLDAGLAYDFTEPEVRGRKFRAVKGCQKLNGIGLIDGFAIGKVVLHKRLEQAAQLLAKDSQKEVQRLLRALNHVEREVNKILASSHMSGGQSDIPCR